MTFMCPFFPKSGYHPISEILQRNSFQNLEMFPSQVAHFGAQRSEVPNLITHINTLQLTHAIWTWHINITDWWIGPTNIITMMIIWALHYQLCGMNDITKKTKQKTFLTVLGTVRQFYQVYTLQSSSSYLCQTAARLPSVAVPLTTTTTMLIN